MQKYTTLQPGQKFNMGVSARMGLKKYQKGVNLNGVQVAGNFTAQPGDTIEFPAGSGWSFTAGWAPEFGAVTLRVLKPLEIVGGKDGWNTKNGCFEFEAGTASLHSSDIFA